MKCRFSFGNSRDKKLTHPSNNLISRTVDYEILPLINCSWKRTGRSVGVREKNPPVLGVIFLSNISCRCFSLVLFSKDDLKNIGRVLVCEQFGEMLQYMI